MSAQTGELARYVMEQLQGLDGVRNIPMMGGYIFYFKERIFGGIYPDGFLMKITPASLRYLPGAAPQPPYQGAKPMLPCHLLNDAPRLHEMVAAMYDELPPPRPKRKKGGQP